MDMLLQKNHLIFPDQFLNPLKFSLHQRKEVLLLDYLHCIYSCYVDCQYDEGKELCKGLYEYTVDDVTYNGSPNSLSNRSGFKNITTVKYNPNNPNEYVMDSGWNTLLIVGIIIIAVALIIFISGRRALKNLAKKINETVKDNQVINI